MTLGTFSPLVRPPLLVGEDCKLGTRIGMEFLHDSTDVILDRTLGEKQSLPNLPVAPTLGDELEYFLLLVVQSLDGCNAVG
jgi:hypothetical protein